MAVFAIVTQSYSKDIRECELLCESMDRFVSSDVPHYIIVNDEDYDMFRSNPAFSRRHIHRKGVFLRPFGLDDISRTTPDGHREWMLYKRIFEDEPNHDQYCRVARAMMTLPEGSEPDSFCYMAHPVVFERRNLEALLCQIASRSLFGSWKHRLCNTYRFSEYYLYGLYTDHVLHLRNHYLYDTRLFPATHIERFHTASKLREAVAEAMSRPYTLGVWLQKGKRTATVLPHDTVASVIREWF